MVPVAPPRRRVLQMAKRASERAVPGEQGPGKGESRTRLRGAEKKQDRGGVVANGWPRRTGETSESLEGICRWRQPGQRGGTEQERTRWGLGGRGVRRGAWLPF